MWVTPSPGPAICHIGLVEPNKASDASCQCIWACPGRPHRHQSTTLSPSRALVWATPFPGSSNHSHQSGGAQSRQQCRQPVHQSPSGLPRGHQSTTWSQSRALVWVTPFPCRPLSLISPIKLDQSNQAPSPSNQSNQAQSDRSSPICPIRAGQAVYWADWTCLGLIGSDWA